MARSRKKPTTKRPTRRTEADSLARRLAERIVALACVLLKEEGAWSAHVPSVPGVYGLGRTFEESRKDLIEGLGLLFSRIEPARRRRFALEVAIRVIDEQDGEALAELAKH